MTFIHSLMLLLLSSSFYSLVNAGVRTDLPMSCSNAKKYCTATIKETGGSPVKIRFELECHCLKRKDIYDDLVYLEDIKCPHIPNNENSEIIDESMLLLKDCDVEKKEFPLKLLRILRRSRSLEIRIEGAKTMRLSRNFDLVTPQAVNINARIINSYVSGIGTGWFNKAQSLDLSMENTTIGILEYGFLDGFPDEAQVKIQMRNLNITNFNMHGVSLPPKGLFSINGGRISLIENFAFTGGSEIDLQNLVVASIKKNAFNLLNVQSFLLSNSTIASTNERIIVSNHHDNREYSSEENEIGFVTITKNVFSKLNKNAFAGLCNEKSLKFEENVIMDVEPLPVLETKKCKYDRNWLQSVWGTIFQCDIITSELCEAFKTDDSNQTCIFYRTSLCICQNSDGNCNKPMSEFVKNNCPPEIYNKLNNKCEEVINPDADLSGRSEYQTGNKVDANVAQKSLIMLAIIVVMNVSGVCGNC